MKMDCTALKGDVTGDSVLKLSDVLCVHELSLLHCFDVRVVRRILHVGERNTNSGL